MYSFNRYLDKAEQKAVEILAKFGIIKPSVPIKDIILSLELNVVSYDFGQENEVSGMLVINNGQGTIGYNPRNLRVRQRFTMAHELGHYILHKNSENDLFVDKDFIVKYRSGRQYSSLELKQEQEANAFAAAILMPKDLMQAEAASKDYQDLSETEFIKAMAKVFDVSVPAMTYRIANSNLFL